VQVGQVAVLAGAEEFARSANLQIRLGDRETVRGLEQRAQPRFAVLAGSARDERADSGSASAAHPAPQLMQLREAEALCVLDDHQARIRHVDTHFDHRRRDEHLGLAGREARHRGIARGRVQLAVDEIHCEPGKRRADLLGGFAGRAQVDLLTLRDEWIDDVDLLTARGRIAQEPGDRLPLARAKQVGRGLRAPGRQLVDHG